MSKSGKRLIAAAEEALAIAEGRKDRPRLFVPADIDVRAIRRSLKLSQDDFASEFGFSVTQIRDWEQGRARPTGGSRAYLMVIQKSPEAVRAVLLALNEEREKEAAA